jgi:glycosyltransferase involved in cell wall biosynthesis
MLSYTSLVTIAFDATPLTVPTGGVARYTWELARSLAARYPGDEYWMLSDQPFRFPGEGPRNLHRGDAPHSMLEKKWWLWGLQKEMMRRRVHLFHGTDFSVPYLASRPSVMTLHDLSPWLDPTWQPSAGRIRRRTGWLLQAGRATMVITPSEAVRRAAIERFRLQPDRVVAVPLAASDHFRPVPCEPAAPYFLFVGTLEPRKNLHRLVDAWRQVRKTHAIDLVIAGRTRADFPPIPPEPGLRITGAANESDLPRLYSGALAVVYPSLYEGFGLPALEAMQCGALVVTSQDPAILEVTGDGAVHAEATDVRALAAALKAIATSPEPFADTRRRAIQRAAGFSWDRTAERTREVYDAAIRVFKT